MELSFEANPGDFGMELSAPGPRYKCEVIEADASKFTGTVFGSNLQSGSGRRRRAASAPGVVVRAVRPGSFAQAKKNRVPVKGFCRPNQPAGTGSSGCLPIPPVGPNTTTNVGAQTAPQQVIFNQKSQYTHNCDGEFTGWSVGSDPKLWKYKFKEKPSPEPLFEWHDIKPARGRFTNAYLDFDGEYLHILNDWSVNHTS